MPIDRNSAQYITGAIYKPTQTSAPGVWDLDDQANNLAKNLWPLPPQAVQRSLRFNSADSAYLNRTFSANGNFQSFTVSCWVKRSAFGASNPIFVAGTDTADYMFITFTGADLLNFTTGENGTTNLNLVNTTAVFRDTSAWYHIVVAIDFANGTSTDRIKIYVNGTRQALTGTFASTAFTGTRHNRSGIAHYIGRWMNGSSYFNGYIAEFYFVDGLTLDPTSFGETDQQTGVWIPKRYVGTYGTNGFRLPFTNNTSTTALGYDFSGNGNNWTPNNFSVTPGAGNDSLLDVPSLYGVDTGLGGEVLGNYAILNPLDVQSAVTLSNGNLDISGGNNIRATLACTTSGKWYFEYTKTNATSSGNLGHVGIFALSSPISSLTDGSMLYREDGGLYENNILQSVTYASYTTGDVIGVAINCDAGNISYYKNGVLQGTRTFVTQISSSQAIPAVRNNPGQTATCNFGQRPFVYTAPSGFKALCTTNLPAPAIGQTSNNQADNHFAAVTYTGNNGTQTISTLGFQPDFIWIKNRTGANSHILVDSIRGAGKGLSSESTAIEYNIPTDFQSFNSNGFTVGYGGTNITNASANNYVAWCWNAGGVSVTNNAGTNGASVASTYRANKAAGFSIVSWTYNGAATIAHGLNAVPKFMIIRGKNAVYNWDVYHASIGPTVRLVLNSTSGSQTYSGPFNNTTPTSSVFSQGAAWYSNGDSLIGYIFAEIPGYSAFGSYTGNGSADGPFIYTGFKPALILGKRTDTSSTQGWFIFDTARNIANQVDLYLSPSSANNEGTFTLGDMLSNGFKIRNTIVDWNSSGLPYIYAAFAETPARLSTAR